MNNSNKFTGLHRILHWFTALAMSILFLTGFLRMYWAGKKAVAEAITSQGIEIPKEQAKAVYKSLISNFWDWHIIASYIMIGIFILRIIYMATKGIRFPNPFKRKQPFQEILQGLTYIYFYLFVAVQIFTGIRLEYKILAEYKKQIEATHKWAIYLFPIFIMLHFIGVLVAEFSNKKGITSKMISGE